MRRLMLGLCAVVLGLGFALPAQADRDGVVRFATLPKPGPGHPEGLAADSQGNIYVATFDSTTTNRIYVFGRDGRLQFFIPLPGVGPLGMAFDAAGNLYVANFGGGNVLKFTPPFTSASTPSATYPVCSPVPFVDCGLNDLTFDAAGNLYVSDSFGGNIYRITLPAGTTSVFFTDPRLAPVPNHSFPPFGANGLAFKPGTSDLYVAHTGDDRIFRLSGGALSAFAESINGADGIKFDASGRLWVAANQQDEVVALNALGAVVERRGSFEGIDNDGAPRGLLFPASIAISDGDLFVTNLALPLTPQVGNEPEEQVTTFTVSRLPSAAR